MNRFTVHGITMEERTDALFTSWPEWRTEEMRTKRLMLLDSAIEVEGVLRWKAMGRCVPVSVLYNDMGLMPTVLQAAAYDEEVSKVVNEYRTYRGQVGYSAEERYEMRAAFGDEPVVDVLTGRRVN